MLQVALILCSSMLPAQEGARTPGEILSEIRSQGNKAPAKLFEELGSLRNAEALEALMKAANAVSRVEKISTAYRAFRHFQGISELDRRAAAFLAKEARQNQEHPALNAVYHLGALWPAGREALISLTLELDAADGRSVALMYLVEHDMPLDAKALKRLVHSKDPAVRYEGLLARALRIEEAADRTRAVTKLARSRDAIERLVAAELSASAEDPARLERLQLALDDDDRRVARKALASLERTRDKAAVELLIARMSRAKSGERFRISGVLERLTGKSLGLEPGRWQRWWTEEGATFVLPDAAAKAPRAKTEGHTNSSFYGLPIFANSLVFAIDASKSMNKPADGKSGPSRMDIARRELTTALRNLPRTSNFDIVHFGKSAWSWSGELVPAADKNKSAAEEHLLDMKLTLGTEIYGALREAFRDPRADSILLLTDGDPYSSLMQDRPAMQRIVTQWNRTRHTTVDCLSIGTERKWLRKLAAATGGRYEEVQ
jgi:hypothetical protein